MSTPMNATELEQRQRIVIIAKQWVGTPYRHGARIKGIAADCTFFAAAFEEAGLVPHVPISAYSSSAHLHRASGQYLIHIRKYAHEVEKDKVRPGDIAMFHIARDFSHGGIINAHGWPEHVKDFEQVMGWPWIIHGDMEAGVILEARGDQAHLAMAREVKFFSLW
jgi:hypothetical protein